MLGEGNVWLCLRPVHRLTIGHGRVGQKKAFYTQTRPGITCSSNTLWATAQTLRQPLLLQQLRKICFNFFFIFYLLAIFSLNFLFHTSTLTQHFVLYSFHCHACLFENNTRSESEDLRLLTHSPHPTPSTPKDLAVALLCPHL